MNGREMHRYVEPARDARWSAHRSFGWVRTDFGYGRYGSGAGLFCFFEETALGSQSASARVGWRENSRGQSRPLREVSFPATAVKSAAQLQYLKHPARMVKNGMVNSAARNFYPPHFCVFFRDSGRFLDSWNPVNYLFVTPLRPM